MDKIIEKIKQNPLFIGIEANHLKEMLVCLSARQVQYDKNALILLTGDYISFVGLVLSGSVRVMKEDERGNSTILAELSKTDLFGEVFACAGVERSPVTVRASNRCEVLFMNYRKIITVCSFACPFHGKLIENMIRLIARKNLLLNQKNEILSKRSIREKIECFFDMERGKEKKFTIPFNREEMAHYLCVDRSALSKELCKMREEGIIEFHKNRFEIL